MTVYVRLELDRYDLDMIERLVAECVITVGEACEHVTVKRMSDVERLMWVRKVQAMRPRRSA